MKRINTLFIKPRWPLFVNPEPQTILIRALHFAKNQERKKQQAAASDSIAKRTAAGKAEADQSGERSSPMTRDLES